MPQTIAQLPVITPAPAAPMMTASEWDGFREAVAILRAERALQDHTQAGCAAILAAVPS